MTAQTAQSQVNPTQQPAENKQNDKEYNFRQLEQKYERQLSAERAAREQAEKLAKEALDRQQVQSKDDDEDDDEPYVDKKKLNKTLNKFGQTTQSEIQKAMEIAKQTAKEELKQEIWMETNKDFYDVLKHAEKFAQEAPELAETILRMPEGFERQKLVYQSIKRLGMDKPPQKQPSIQDKIDANKRNPYYQPSGVGSAPYANAGDFSETGQKQAYSKLQELKNRLRLG